jgi:hypothetical protein
MRDHRAKYSLASKDSALRATFGISLADYGRMLVEQDGKCAICRHEETQMRGGVVKALSVDHDHTTGKVRGLLCADCNHMIGKAKENRDTLLAAIRYLDKHSGRTAPTLTVVPNEEPA